MAIMEGRLQPPRPACFFFAISSGREDYQPEVEAEIARRFGEISARTEVYSFSQFSRYYDREMGGPVWKYLVALERYRNPDELVEVKLFTEDLQGRSLRESPGGRARLVNIDPGYLNGWQVVLATVKNSSHRIYLSSGVYCELTLRYKNNRYESMPWTYPDYAVPFVQEFLSARRAEYLSRCGD